MCSRPITSWTIELHTAMHAGYGFCVVGLIDVATDKALVLRVQEIWGIQLIYFNLLFFLFYWNKIWFFMY